MGNKNTRKVADRRRRAKTRSKMRSARISHILNLIDFNNKLNQRRFVVFYPCVDDILNNISAYEYRHLAKNFRWLEGFFSDFCVTFVSSFEGGHEYVQGALNCTGNSFTTVYGFQILSQSGFENEFTSDYFRLVFEALYHSDLWYSSWTRDIFFEYVSFFVLTK